MVTMKGPPGGEGAGGDKSRAKGNKIHYYIEEIESTDDKATDLPKHTATPKDWAQEGDQPGEAQTEKPATPRAGPKEVSDAHTNVDIGTQCQGGSNSIACNISGYRWYCKSPDGHYPIKNSIFRLNGHHRNAAAFSRRKGSGQYQKTI